MRNHRKVKMLRNKFGLVLGYAFWSMFLEVLTESDGNEIEYSEIEMEGFASELGVSATEISDMIAYCIKIELLFEKQGFLCSESLDENLALVYEKRERAKKSSATRSRRENGTFIITKDFGTPDYIEYEKAFIRFFKPRYNKQYVGNGI
jgi:hypothetical protein